MLPSKEMKALCAKVPVAAIGINDPLSKRLMKEFSVPYVSSWVVVLNNKGEAVASFQGDAASAGCTKETANKFPQLLVKKINDCVAWTKSVVALETRWKTTKAEVDFENLVKLLVDMKAYGKAAWVCEKQMKQYKPKDIPDALVARVIKYKNEQRVLDTIRKILTERARKEK